jgi:AcrR family transcriptional regulator
MARTRWGAETPEDAKDAKRLLVDAAELCFDRYGVAKTSVEDIADAAKVSRATVYRYFAGGRDEMLLAVAKREFGRFSEQTMRKTNRRPAFAEGLVEGVLLAVRAARERPTLAMLIVPESAGLTGPIQGGGEALRGAFREMLAPVLERAKERGRARQDLDVDEAAEWTIRIIHSLLTLPSQRRIAEERRFLHEFFIPAFLPRLEPMGADGTSKSAAITP